MQTVEQNGYTKAEIYAALQGKTGSRTITYRYEQLDRFNTLINKISKNVLSCSISQGYLDDVKRTAKMTVIDDGSINFASDRIKPWARIKLPTDTRDYATYTNSLNYIKTAEFLFNGSDTTAAVHNTGVAGSAFNGTVNATGGTSVLLGQTGIIEGSAVRFQGNTAPAASGYVTVKNGTQFFNNASVGASAVSTAWSLSLFLIWTGSATGFGNVDPIIKDTVGNLQFSINQQSIYYSVQNAAGGMAGTIPNPYGYGLRHIAITWSINSTPIIYLNGVQAPGVVTATSTFTGAVASATGDLLIGYGFNGTIDALTFYNGALQAADILNIYRAGIRQGPFGSYNYAEWPQGVFLLSSPTRTSDDNGFLTRDIDCYDQAQVYIDDVVSSRYTAQVGTTYINNILSLLINYVPQSLNIADQNIWFYPPGSNISFAPTGGSATIPGPTTGPGTINYVNTSQIYTIVNHDFQVNLTMPGSATGTGGLQRMVQFGFHVYTDIYQWIYLPNSNNISANYTQAGSGFQPYSATYDAVAMKYLRTQESRGYITFQTSPDGVTWTVRATVVSPGYTSPIQYLLDLNTANGPGTTPAWNLIINSLSLSAAVLPAAINLSPSTAFLPLSKDYDPGTTKLAIINDLLGQINYNSLWFDESGTPVIQPYVVPSSRPPEYVYADDATSVMMPAASDTYDLYGVPNQWVLVASNPDATLYAATYTNANPLSPSSTISRGRTIVHYELETDAVDLLTLQARAVAMANAASQVYDELTFTTAVMPFHSNADVLGISFSIMKIFDKYSETKWSFDCKEGATMSHTVRKQVQV